MNNEYTSTIRYAIGEEYVTIVVRKMDPVLVLCRHIGTKHIIAEKRVVYCLKTIDGQYLERDLTDLRHKSQQRDMELFFREVVKKQTVKFEELNKKAKETTKHD